MSHWILFVFVTYSPAAGSGIAAASQTFHSQQACEQAAQALKASALSFETIKAFCVEDKGGKDL